MPNYLLLPENFFISQNTSFSSPFFFFTNTIFQGIFYILTNYMHHLYSVDIILYDDDILNSQSRLRVLSYALRFRDFVVNLPTIIDIIKS